MIDAQQQRSNYEKANSTNHFIDGLYRGIILEKQSLENSIKKREEGLALQDFSERFRDYET